MQQRAAFVGLSLAFVAGVALAACTQASPTPAATLVYDYKSLIVDLGSAGATVEELARPPESSVGFSVGGPRVGVNGGMIQVHEFPDTRAADTEAGYVSPDGYTITVPLGGGRTRSTHSDWVAPPHYYKKGRVIVRYVGDSMAVLKVLEAVLGPQFAGPTTPTPTPAAPVSHADPSASAPDPAILASGTGGKQRTVSGWSCRHCSSANWPWSRVVSA